MIHSQYGSANDIGDILKNVKGKNVVIVGGGAFAVENVRTFLMHGAKHVRPVPYFVLLQTKFDDLLTCFLLHS